MAIPAILSDYFQGYDENVGYDHARRELTERYRYVRARAGSFQEAERIEREFRRAMEDLERHRPVPTMRIPPPWREKKTKEPDLTPILLLLEEEE